MSRTQSIEKAANAAWNKVKENKKTSIGCAVGAVVLLGLLLSTFAIPQTKGAMQHMWTKVGQGIKAGYTNSHALGVNLRYATSSLVGAAIGAVTYAKREKIKDAATGAFGYVSSKIKHAYDWLKSRSGNDDEKA